MFKKFKIEFFYARKMFKSYGLSWPYWFRYLKNKYFGNLLLKNLKPWHFDRYDDFELHVLTQKHALWMTAIGLRSFLYFSGLKPRIIIHGDGSLDKSSASLLESKFEGAKVILRKDADKIIENNSDISEKLKEYRRKGTIILKLTDIFLLRKSNKILVFDNDLLFFSRPAQIIEFMAGRSLYKAIATLQHKSGPWISDDLMLDKEYQNKYSLLGKGLGRVNTGLICINMNGFHIGDINEYFEHTRMKPDHYFIEAAGWCALLSRLNLDYFSLDRYHINNRPHRDTIVRHFTSPSRHEIYAYGIDMVRKRTRTNQQNNTTLLSVRLNNRTVLITGASIGIGAEVAYAFAKEGSNVIISYYQDRNKARGVVKKCLKLGSPSAVAFPLNLKENASITNFFRKVSNQFNQIDILVNNAGSLLKNFLRDATFEEIEDQMRVNLEGLIKITKCFLPVIRGSIINIASRAGLSGVGGTSVYSASKFGVRGFTQSLAKEVSGLNVYVVNPGPTATRMTNFGGEKPTKVAQIVVNIAKRLYRIPSGSDINVWEN